MAPWVPFEPQAGTQATRRCRGFAEDLRAHDRPQSPRRDRSRTACSQLKGGSLTCTCVTLSDSPATTPGRAPLRTPLPAPLCPGAGSRPHRRALDAPAPCRPPRFPARVRPTGRWGSACPPPGSAVTRAVTRRPLQDPLCSHVSWGRSGTLRTGSWHVEKDPGLLLPVCHGCF